MTVDDPVPFRPRPPWLTGDLQTIRNMLRRDAPDPGPFVRLWLDRRMAMRSPPPGTRATAPDPAWS